MLENTIYIDSVPSLLLDPKTIYLDTVDGDSNHDTRDCGKSKAQLDNKELNTLVPRLESITVITDYIAHLIQTILVQGRTLYPSQFHSKLLQW